MCDRKFFVFRLAMEGQRDRKFMTNTHVRARKAFSTIAQQRVGECAHFAREGQGARIHRGFP